MKGFISNLQSSPIDANLILQMTLGKANADNKLVFLHFGPPWCGWCHKMEDWMAEPEIEKIVSKSFVDLKVETDRMIGGEELLKKYCPKQGGIPWFAFVSADDIVIATSDGPNGNIGFPSSEDEIEHFLAILKETARFSKEEIQELDESLVANRKARENKARKSN